MSTREWFVMTNSFAAPFFSDSGSRYVEAATAREAAEKVAAEYSHPAGLYAAVVYPSADAYHKGADPQARWLCNHEQAKQRATDGKSGYSYLGHGPGDFELNGERMRVEDPKGGSVVP